MTRRSLVVALGVISAFVATFDKSLAAERPNIIIIMSDDKYDPYC